MATNPPLRILFLGTPNFAVPTLKALLNNPDVAEVVGVYTQPDRPAGRGQKLSMPPVKEVALAEGLPVFQPKSINSPDEKRKFSDHMADVAVVVAYAQFLSPGILNTPRLGCINVHSSLLPKYRGAAPIQYALLNGDKETGVTTMRLVEKMDAGPILLQQKVKINDSTTADKLYEELAAVGSTLLIETLRLLRDRKLDEKEQDEDKVSFAPIIKKKDGLIDWTKSGKEILNQIRAFTPWPGTYGRSSKGTLKIHKAKFREGVSGAPKKASEGSTFSDAGCFWVRCADGWIELLEVQPEGKKKMGIQEFLNGIQNKESFSLQQT